MVKSIKTCSPLFMAKNGAIYILAMAKTVAIYINLFIFKFHDSIFNGQIRSNQIYLKNSSCFSCSILVVNLYLYFVCSNRTVRSRFQYLTQQLLPRLEPHKALAKDWAADLTDLRRRWRQSCGAVSMRKSIRDSYW